MQRLIDADALIESMTKFSNATGEDMTHGIFYAHIAPTIDAVPVRHGKWEIEISDYGHQATYRCSECGHQFKWIYNPYFPPVFNYCQKCGARMDEE